MPRYYRSKTTKLSPEQRAAAKAMYEEGGTLADVAEYLGMAIPTARKVLVAEGCAPHKRGRGGPRFSAAREQVLSLLGTGSDLEIARKVGLTRQRVHQIRRIEGADSVPSARAPKASPVRRKRRTPTLDAMRDALREHGPMTSAQLGKAVGLPEKHRAPTCYNTFKRGHLVRVPGMTPTHWTLP